MGVGVGGGRGKNEGVGGGCEWGLGGVGGRCGSDYPVP